MQAALVFVRQNAIGPVDTLEASDLALISGRLIWVMFLAQLFVGAANFVGAGRLGDTKIMVMSGKRVLAYRLYCLRRVASYHGSRLRSALRQSIGFLLWARSFV
jgi:hypothetical protein